MTTRESLDRNRRYLKRDYNRIVEEINKLIKPTLTIEVIEQLNTLRLSIATTKTELNKMYYAVIQRFSIWKTKPIIS